MNGTMFSLLFSCRVLLVVDLIIFGVGMVCVSSQAGSGGVWPTSGDRVAWYGCSVAWRADLSNALLSESCVRSHFAGLGRMPNLRGCCGGGSCEGLSNWEAIRRRIPFEANGRRIFVCRGGELGSETREHYLGHSKGLRPLNTT